MPLIWVLRSYLPSLLILLISAILIFALILVSSITFATDSVLQLIGGGSVLLGSEPDLALPDNTVVNRVAYSNALASTGEKNLLISLRGVEDDYFFSERARALKLERIENPTTLKGLIVSKAIAEELGAGIGDRLALLLYDEEHERVRPVYFFIEGLYSTGYAEFDKSLAFSDIEAVQGRRQYELYNEDFEALISALDGVNYLSYRDRYASIYANLDVSTSMLYLIVLLISILAGFFALSISSEYVERDRKDIASMMLLGVRKKAVVISYVRITMRVVFAAVALSVVLGVLASYIFCPIISSLDPLKYPALQNYVLSFEVKIPLLMVVLTPLVLLLTSYVSLRISLSHYVFTSPREALSAAW